MSKDKKGKKDKKEKHSKKSKKREKKEKRLVKKKHGTKSEKPHVSEINSKPVAESVALSTSPVDPEEQRRKQVRAAAMAPLRPEVHAKEQSKIREVFDEQTGRMRLVRGSGEIIERIVSRGQQKAIQEHASRHGWDYKSVSGMST